TVRATGAVTADYPSGQRELTVNQLALPTGVRIPHLPRRRVHVIRSTGDAPELPPGKEVGKVHRVALIAQSAERLHGKEKVKGSLPFHGSDGGGGTLSSEIGPPRRSRRGSSAGESARLIIVRSRVRSPPSVPHRPPLECRIHIPRARGPTRCTAGRASRTKE